MGRRVFVAQAASHAVRLPRVGRSRVVSVQQPAGLPAGDDAVVALYVYLFGRSWRRDGVLEARGSGGGPGKSGQRIRRRLGSARRVRIFEFEFKFCREQNSCEGECAARGKEWKDLRIPRMLQKTPKSTFTKETKRYRNRKSPHE